MEYYKIPLLLKVHPLHLFSHLKNLNYNIILFNKKISKDQINDKTIIVLFSLFDLLTLMEYCEQFNIDKVKLIVVTKKKELKLFDDYSLMFELLSKKNIKDFSPYYVGLNLIDQLDIDINKKLKTETKYFVPTLKEKKFLLTKLFNTTKTRRKPKFVRRIRTTNQRSTK